MPVSILSPLIQRLIGPAAADGGLLIDAVLRETVGHEAIKTAFPIELGAEISDHLIPKPGLYSLQGVVSDHPIYWSSTDYQHEAADTRHLSAYAILRDLWTRREVFSIETGFLGIESAVLVSFNAEKTAATARTFRFEAHIDEIVIVNTQQSVIDSSTVSVEGEGVVAEEDRGTQVGTPPDNRTALLTALEFVFGGGQ